MPRAPGYGAIADKLRAAIQRGDYPPGELLPTQRHLADDYGVNLLTVRRAINQLHAEGLVDPTAGRGTVVRERNLIRLPADRYTKPTVGKGVWEAACFEQGLTGSTVVGGVSWLPADRIIAGYLEVKLGSQVCRRSSRSAVDDGMGDQVRQLQDTWFPESVARGTPLEVPSKLPRSTGAGIIYGALKALGYELGTAVEEISTRMPTRDERSLLGLRLGSPVLDERRTTSDRSGLVIVHTHVVHSGDHVSLVFPQEL